MPVKRRSVPWCLDVTQGGILKRLLDLDVFPESGLVVADHVPLVVDMSLWPSPFGTRKGIFLPGDVPPSPVRK